MAVPPARFVAVVTVPVVVANVPEVGNVTVVMPVIVNVDANAPDVVNEPPKVIVLAPLLIPVPPYVPAIMPACHAPETTVPKVVMEVCPT